MFNKINYFRERRAYKKYARLNIKRKAKENSLKVFKMFDSIRRKTGFVK